MTPSTHRKNSPPLRYTNVLQVRLNDDQIGALRLAAAEDGISQSEAARNAIEAHLIRLHPEFFAPVEPELAP